MKVKVDIHDGEDIKILDEGLKEHPDVCKYTFPEHLTLSGMNVEVMNCLPSKVDEIKREYPDYIDSIFSLSKHF